MTARRTAFISGGAGGIGRAIGDALARDNIQVILADIDQGRLEGAVRSIDRDGRRATGVTVDLADLARTRAAIERCISESGPIGILVNNVGVVGPTTGVLRVTEQEFEHVFRVNLLSAFTACQAVIPAMRATGTGDIIMISSVAAEHCGAGSVAYNVSKAGLEALAFTLAKEERRHGIRVNVVAPGLVDTAAAREHLRRLFGERSWDELDGATAFGSSCAAEDVAEVVRLLVMPAARRVSGQRIVVNGGNA